MKFGNEFWLILFREYIIPNLFAVSLVGDIPAGDGKTAINFLQCTYVLFSHVFKYVLLYNIYIFEREKAESWSFALSQVIF
jgi:hypothetical protein